jgi:predicted nucleotidyltransferase
MGKSRTMESPPGLKQTLQRMVVATQYPPFLWCYRLLYALAVRLCTRRLRRIRGVSAIYLRRGLAGGKPMYGLSDIDLLVMVDGELSGKTAARVRHQYDLLRRIVPMLPEPAELEIYNREHFRLLYEYSPFYRGRFDQGRRDWQRLHGEDIFTALPPPGDDARPNAWQELRPAWNHLARELVPDTDSRKSALPLFVRRYIAYKAIAEAARASLVAQDGDLSISRDLALLRAASAVPEQAEYFKEVRRLRKNLLEPRPPQLDELLYIFQSLANRTMAATAESAPVTKKLRILAVPDNAGERLLSGADISAIGNACAELEGIGRAVLVPRLAFDALATLDLDPIELAGATTDAWDLVLIVRTPPAAKALHRFNAALNRLHPLVTAYFCNGEMAFSTRPTKGWAIKVRRAAPEFFSCLSSAKPLSGRLEIADGIEVERPLERENALELRAGTLLELFSRSEAFRLPVRSFFALFWEAGRAACMAHQAREPLIEVPVSSAQIVEMLARYTPSEAAVLRMIHAEYWKEGHAHPSESHRFMHWAGRYALMLHERLFSPGSAAAQLPAQARTELTISVTIVTRNRAPLLRKALQSLVEQERAPDQVVIVDNASTDDTAAAARSFQDRLKMTLITERQVGIPIARNTSLKHCTGDIVALLDDDCIADRRWLAEIEEPFLRDPHIAAVGGKLVPVEGRRELIAQFYDSRMRDAAHGGAQPG